MSRYLWLLILIATQWTGAAESKLHGTWRSDLQMTSDYLLKHGNPSEHQKKGFAILFGKTVITFMSDGTGSSVREAFVIPTKDGARLPMSEAKSHFSYVILGESENQVVIRITMDDPAIAKSPFVIMKFQDKDVYSVEIGDNPFNLVGREFFQRSSKDAR